MNLPLRIALRYLFAKKSHNIINIISLISAIGIAVGSMALIIILSGYNGFDTLVKSTYNSYEADLVLTPQTGKKIPNTDKIISKLKRYGTVTPVIEENVFVIYGDNQTVAGMRGINITDNSYKMAANLQEGEFKLFFGDIPQAVTGTSLAYALGIRTRFVDKLEVYFPKKGENTGRNLLSLAANPLAALNKDEFPVAGILNLEKNFDKNLFYIPIANARKLAEYGENEATSIEVYLLPDKTSNSKKAEKEIRTALEGMNIAVKNHYQQNEAMYKIMRIEKFVIFLILFFVVMIISINIFSSLAMLIIDKNDDIATLSSMGATTDTIKKIFVLQGWLISVAGAISGIIIGLIICLLQIKFGIVSLPGNFITNTFPMEIRFMDMLAVLVGVTLGGYLIAGLAAKKIKKCNEQNIYNH